MNVLASGALRLGTGRAIVHPATDQPVDSLCGESPPRYAGGQDHCSSTDAIVAIESDHVRRMVPVGPLGSQAYGLASAYAFGFEPSGLAQGAKAELVAGKADRKAEIVLDACGTTSLPAGSKPLDQHGLQPFGCAIDGSRQPGGSAAHDHDVVASFVCPH